MNLKATPKQFHITYRNIAGSMRQTWVSATQHYQAIETFKNECGHTMDPEHSPLNIKEMVDGLAVNRWYMENAYHGLPERIGIKGSVCKISRRNIQC